MEMETKYILEAKNITKLFGGVHAVKNVSFSLKYGCVVALIGPNGAGKTTLFNLISGVYIPNEGKICFEDVDLKRKRQHSITKMGITRTFQIVRPFLKMTAIENVMVGAMFGGREKTNKKKAEKKALQSLKFVGLGKRKNDPSSSLTLINRKMVEIAKALASDPKLVLLDEPLSGLNPTEIEDAVKLISKIKEELGITVFWVEHVMDAVMSIADNIIVLNYGEKIAEETPDGLFKNQNVIDAYLGEEYTF